MTALATATVDEQVSRRGPMRPRRLVSARANRSKRLASHLFRWADLIALAVVTVLTVAVRLDDPDGLLAVPSGEVLPLVAGALVLGRAMRSLAMYRFARREGLVVHVGRVLLAGTFAVVAALLVDWLVGRHGPAATTCLVWTVAAAGTLVVLHAIWWWRVHHWRAAGWLVPNVIVVGATEHAEELIAEALRRRHVNVVGVFDDRLARAPAAVLGVPVLGDVDALLTHRITPFVDLIVVAVDPEATRRVREIAARLAMLPNEVDAGGRTRRQPARGARSIDRLDDSPLAPLSGVQRPRAQGLRQAPAGPAARRARCSSCSARCSPLIAVLVKLDSRGPVFFRQRRHGFNNEEIVVWKFRTMRAETPRRTGRAAGDGQRRRVTRVGRILRSTSLDELPQLLNVVRGEMSLVGPRPHAIGMKTGDVESARLVAEYAHRHRMKPGMTGWAAIHGSRGPLHEADDVQRRVALDVEYIARQSFWLDLSIMVMTVPSMLGDRHAVR